MEVEAIGRVRHKNLVRLLGYCVEGAYRYNFSSFFSLLLYSPKFWAFDSYEFRCLLRDLNHLNLSFIRMLVYEYVDNGNLDQWLHGDVGDVSPLTWEIRMNIILGTAKGY